MSFHTPPSTPTPHRLQRRGRGSPATPSSARFSHLLSSVLGSPFVTTTDLVDLVDGENTTVPHSDTVTRPPSPDHGFEVIQHEDSDEEWSFRRSPFRSILPRLWDVLSTSPPRRPSPFSYSSSSSSIWTSKPIDYSQLPPLDGEEGELIDDEACFFCPPVRAVTGIDILSLLPPELALHTLSLLAPTRPDPHSPASTVLADIPDHVIQANSALTSLLACRSVSRKWARFANDNSVWRSLYTARWGTPPTLSPSLSPYTPPPTPSRRNSTMPDIRMKKLPALPPGESVFPAPLALDFSRLYRARLELDRRWEGLHDEQWSPRPMALAGHTDSVYCLEFSRTHIITGSRDRSVKVWSLTSGRLLGTFKGQHKGSVLCLKFELEETHPATGGLRGFLVTGSSDCNVCVWDLWTEHGGEDAQVFGEVRAVLRGHGGGVLDLRIDQKWIVSCAKDAAIRVWSRESLDLHRTLRGHEGPVNAVGLQSGAYSEESSQHDGRIVSASGDGKMILWDIASGERVRTFEGHDRGLACIEFKGDLIISGSNDCKIKIWSASSGACLRTLVGHEGLVRALSCDPQNGRLVSVSYDRSVRVWDLGTGRAIRVVRDSHTSHIFDVKFDSRRIVSTSHDRKIVVLDFSLGLGVNPALFV
ncbi:WD-REPEATS-REGION domain-containing protein [Mycena indigotica]|uniref:WD-REPEATS-REGION domain-containing protein n=1 Tax=Mycena indigotica TaxID=2126181 RepID=A0A8H6VUZ4_9AGAR|nr:WD-REPEATS-REGION domain-containing protein [Mycena indigotica]KAF7292936.1 WD-REPEATS-REGION domain-containing protein [Mycena indigotica]